MRTAWRVLRWYRCKSGSSMQSDVVWRATALVLMAALAAVAHWQGLLRQLPATASPLTLRAAHRASGPPLPLPCLQTQLCTEPSGSGMYRSVATTRDSSCCSAAVPHLPYIHTWVSRGSPSFVLLTQDTLRQHMQRGHSHERHRPEMASHGSVMLTSHLISAHCRRAAHVATPPGPCHCPNCTLQAQRQRAGLPVWLLLGPLAAAACWWQVYG